jgi:uncharacterized protein
MGVRLSSSRLLSPSLHHHASLPCDYADASLIALAEGTGVTAIATIDQRDVSVYRVRGRRRFMILL